MAQDPAQIGQTPEWRRSRALATSGGSSQAIYQMVAQEILSRRAGGVLYDVGCGLGRLHAHVALAVSEYIGVDLISYEGFPASCRFVQADLDQPFWPIDPAVADIVTSVETIEHVENPRHHFRQLVRLLKPGGLLIVTTPNNLSWLSLFTLIARGVFNAFQNAPGLYPGHITALLETDLHRIAAECGLMCSQTRFTNSGRIPFSSRQWPSVFSGRKFSDNLLVSALRGPTVETHGDSPGRR